MGLIIFVLFLRVLTFTLCNLSCLTFFGIRFVLLLRASHGLSRGFNIIDSKLYACKAKTKSYIFWLIGTIGAADAAAAESIKHDDAICHV